MVNQNYILYYAFSLIFVLGCIILYRKYFEYFDENIEILQNIKVYEVIGSNDNKIAINEENSIDADNYVFLNDIQFNDPHLSLGMCYDIETNNIYSIYNNNTILDDNNKQYILNEFINSKKIMKCKK